MRVRMSVKITFNLNINSSAGLFQIDDVLRLFFAPVINTPNLIVVTVGFLSSNTMTF